MTNIFHHVYHPFYVREISQSGFFFVIITLLLSLDEQGSRQFPFNV